MLGPVKSWLNENNKEIDEFPLTPEQVAGLIKLVDNGKLSFTVASGKLFSLFDSKPIKRCGANCHRTKSYSAIRC